MCYYIQGVSFSHAGEGHAVVAGAGIGEGTVDANIPYHCLVRRFFNTTGLCNPEDHYLVNPFRNIYNDILRLIEAKQYFLIHAPRQTGKTTFLHSLAHRLNAEGTYVATVCSLESAGYSSITVEDANEVFVQSMYDRASRQLCKKPHFVAKIPNRLVPYPLKTFGAIAGRSGCLVRRRTHLYLAPASRRLPVAPCRFSAIHRPGGSARHPRVQNARLLRQSFHRGRLAF